MWWIFVTQWFFGPPLIDRGFTLTGGACELVHAAEEGEVEMDDTRQFVTGMACKAVGGKWKGGHDISGHVFLLVLGSMFLFEEVLNVILRHTGPEERVIVMADGSVKSADTEASITHDASTSQAKWDWGVKAGLSVGGLSLWMLLMTAAYFHTWFEKVWSPRLRNCEFKLTLMLVRWTTCCIRRNIRGIFSTSRRSCSQRGGGHAWHIVIFTGPINPSVGVAV